MVHYDYICDACGFTSEEEQGVYNCPKCGNQMRIAKTGYGGGDTSASLGRYLVCLIAFFVSLFLGVLFLGPFFGIIAAFIVTILFWRWARKGTQNKAVRSAGVRNPNKLYTCGNCGGQFKGQLPRCPHCGFDLTYK